MSTHPLSQETIQIARQIEEMIQRARREAQAEKSLEPEPKRELTTQEVAHILNVEPRTVYAYVDARRLNPQRTGPKGGKLVFDREEVERVKRSEK
jgi:excisionase family DNA binding protein